MKTQSKDNGKKALSSGYGRPTTRRAIVLVLFIIILFSGMFSSALYSVKDNNKIKVGIFHFDPLCSIDEQGKYHGLFVELLEYVAQQEHWDIKYIPADLPNNVHALLQGKIHLMPAVSFSPDNRILFDFNEETVISTWAQAYTLEEGKVKSPIDLKGKSVGLVRDEPYSRDIRSITKSFNIECTFMEFNNSREVFKALLAGWIEVGVVDRLYGILNEKETGVHRTPVVFSPVELRFAAPKNQSRNYLDALDYHLKQLKSNPDSLYYEKMNQTLGVSKSPRKIYTFLTWGLGIALGLLILFGGTSYLLHKQVEAKTKELSQKNETLKQEISEREQAEDALRESEEKFRLISEQSLMPIAILQDEVFIYFNRAMADLSEYSTSEMMTWKPLQYAAFIHPDDRDFVLEQSGKKQRGESDVITHYTYRLYTRSGKLKWIEHYSKTIMYEGKTANLMFMLDITEKRQMEKDLLKSQRIESIGLLAGGIAHDFNNLLAVVAGNIELAKLTVSPEQDQYPLLEAAEKGAFNAIALSQQLLTFSKGGAPIKKTASIRELIIESVNFILRGSAVRPEFHIPEDLSPAEVDTAQISQVFQNLIINAEQAMPEGGVIKIHAENLDNHYPLPPMVLPGKHERYMKITIQDGGIGIPQKYLDKIFDPFFTTKKKGTGLGLSIVFSIIKKHDGCITVDSEPGKGTKFQIYLPASEKSMISSSISEAESTVETAHNRILVMDDNKDIRDLLKLTLDKIGHETTFAVDGQQAINAYKEAMKQGEPFDVVIMDLTISGGMGGKEAIKKLREFHPDVKAIVFSGYSNDPVVANYTDYGFKGTISKPFRIKELRQVLHEVIQG